MPLAAIDTMLEKLERRPDFQPEPLVRKDMALERAPLLVDQGLQQLITILNLCAKKEWTRFYSESVAAPEGTPTQYHESQPMRANRPKDGHTWHVWRGTLVLALLVLMPGLASAQTYWFETYQRVVELIDDGRVEEAASLLEPLIDRRPNPRDRVRLPGNQFLDYLPYYQRARIELGLGEHTLASRSLDLSEAFGAIKRNRRAMADLKQLRLRIEDALEAERRVPVAALKTGLPSR